MEENTNTPVETSPEVATPEVQAEPTIEAPVESAPVEPTPEAPVAEPTIESTAEIAIKEGELAVLKGTAEVIEKGLSELTEKRDEINHLIADKEAEIAQLQA